MDLKAKILELLGKDDYSFKDLADYLQMTEDQLTTVLGNRTVELRNLEAISKALRIPLYSFFRANEYRRDKNQKPYYINKLWTGDDDTKSTSELQEEIALLKEIIAMKEEQLARLK